MKKFSKTLSFTHVFSDGNALTDTAFMERRLGVSLETNEQFFDYGYQVLDSNYLKRDNLQKKWQRAEERKAVLIKQQQEIQKQLQSL